MKICADGYMRVGQPNRVRTPGDHESRLEPLPLKDALAFLLSHTFPGHRRMVREPNVQERQMLHRAMWADSVAERMTLADRVWRSISEAVVSPRNGKPELIQVVRWQDEWAYPLYMEGSVTRVLPSGGVPVPELNGLGDAPDLKVG